MKYRVSLFLFLWLMGLSYVAHAETPAALPTPTLSDFSSDVPDEWISAQFNQGPWGDLSHLCRDHHTDRQLAIKKRLMDIYSWKAFVALSWPTAQKVDKQAFDQKWCREGSGATLEAATKAALASLEEQNDDEVQLELLSNSTQYTVRATRCDRDPKHSPPNGSAVPWRPINGSPLAVSDTVTFPSESQISAANCPRWMTWHTRQDLMALEDSKHRVTPRLFCEDNPKPERYPLFVFALSDFDHLTDVDVPGIQYPLVDQNGNKVYYDVSMNYVSYCTLKRLARDAQNGAHLEFPPGESRGAINHPPLPPQPPLELPGSTELKFAWKVLVPDRDDARRFITRDVEVPDDNPDNLRKDCAAHPELCTWTETQVGLVGMHILHLSKDHMSWIWSTFEQIDNAPDEDSLTTQHMGERKFSFYGDAPGVGHNTIAPTKLTRTEKISSDTVQLNAKVRRILQEQHSVLQYYELVGTQYDPCPSAPNDRVKNAVPPWLRNTVIEPYLPHISSCIGCHSRAKLRKSCCPKKDRCDADFSFIAGGLTCASATTVPSGGSPTVSVGATSP